jgi:hypothetical protein
MTKDPMTSSASSMLDDATLDKLVDQVQNEGVQLLGPEGLLTDLASRILSKAMAAEQADTLRPLLDNARRLRHLVAELEVLTLTQNRHDPTQPDP